MGLDIYFHKAKGVKHPSMTISDYQHYVDKEASKEFTEVVHKLVNKVVNNDGYVDDAFIEKEIKPELENYLSGWEFGSMPSEDNTAFVSTLNTKLIDWLFAEMRWHDFARPDAYFRKVNFIYRYFGNKLEEEQCLVEKGEIEDLIAKCKAVLEKRDEEFSKETLPTVAGFFFGSTDYDEWYYKDCEDAIEKFTKLLEDFDPDKDVIWVVMSW